MITMLVEVADLVLVLIMGTIEHIIIQIIKETTITHFQLIIKVIITIALQQIKTEIIATFTTSDVGKGSSIENRPPFYTLSYIMKIEEDKPPQIPSSGLQNNLNNIIYLKVYNIIKLMIESESENTSDLKGK